MRNFVIIGIAIVLVIAAVFSVDAGLYAAYALFFVALGAAIVLPILSTMQSPGEIKKPLYAIGGMIVLFLISYLMAGSDVSTIQAAKGITAGTSKFVGAGLITFYLISAVAVIGLIYSEITKAIR